MRPNPLHDAGHFLIQPGWFTPVFWLLLLGSAALAVLAWRIEPAQRSPRAVGLWVLRGLVGTMWWQQSLWKIPPNFGGLRYWMQQEAAHAAMRSRALPIGAAEPNLFGPLVYLTEVPRRFPVAWPALEAWRIAWRADGPQSLAGPVLSARRMALDLHVPSHHPGIVRHRPARARPRCGRVAGASSRPGRMEGRGSVLGCLGITHYSPGRHGKRRRRPCERCALDDGSPAHRSCARGCERQRAKQSPG